MSAPDAIRASSGAHDLRGSLRGLCSPQSQPQVLTMPELFRSDYASLVLDESSAIVRYTRSKLPYPTVAAAVADLQDVLAAATHLHGQRHSLLLDVRDAPGRNDVDFERALQPLRAQLGERARLRAVLVRTAAGRLQVERLARASNDGLVTFDDEAAALAYLGGP